MPFVCLWKILKASESDAAFNSVTWLELNEESQGVIEESAEDYKGL